MHTTSFHVLSMICKAVVTLSYTAHTLDAGVAGTMVQEKCCDNVLEQRMDVHSNLVVPTSTHFK